MERRCHGLIRDPSPLRGVTAPYRSNACSLSRLHDHAQTRLTQYYSSGRVISPTQRPLPDNTQHSQETSMSPAGLEPMQVSGRRSTP